MSKEGSERDIIPAMAGFLREKQPVMLLSIHPWALPPGPNRRQAQGSRRFAPPLLPHCCEAVACEGFTGFQ